MSDLKQRLQQQLQLKLGPHQIQLMRLIQLPALALDQRIKEEMESNPALEDESGEPADESSESTGESGEEESLPGQDESTDEGEKSSSEDEFNLNDFMEDDEIPAYRLHVRNIGPDEDRKVMPVVVQKTFHDNLLQQLGLREWSDKEFLIGEYVIGNIDDDGYLRRDIQAICDDLAFTQNITATPEEIEKVLTGIQEFDPPGVGARDLRECLLIQLNRIKNESGGLEIPIRLVTEMFDEFTKKNYVKIGKELKLDEEELKKAITEITHLNPRPGGSTPDSEKGAVQVLPDFILTVQDNELELSLTAPNRPELRLSRGYLNMLEEYASKKNKKIKGNAEALQFIKDKIERAKGFIQMMRERNQTLTNTMNAILQYQKEYFLTGDIAKLKPMILKDIADKTGYDISTVSRVSNQKYVQTPYGTFLVKSYFSESLQSESGEEVSSRAVKKILQEITESEDPRNPYSDDALSRILKKKGYPIARRTVAKYRKMLNIPLARLRKKL
ncbi:MAG: RNA polymerase factor sigma-54 [Bacteroidetes bacterium]|nr:RNA polymerase factor sigma-54 [Bacteroidota bacterium]